MVLATRRPYRQASSYFGCNQQSLCLLNWRVRRLRLWYLQARYATSRQALEDFLPRHYCRHNWWVHLLWNPWVPREALCLEPWRRGQTEWRWQRHCPWILIRSHRCSNSRDRTWKNQAASSNLNCSAWQHHWGKWCCHIGRSRYFPQVHSRNQ